ncbi:MAG TPA: glycosyltransferase family 4 protein [Prolixibacteraceae bacterium]|nr:glycosyltransferase family 4 protein [Prolixibacteraceae bacterium]
MKILFLTNKSPYPPIDGGSIATFGMMKGLTNAGHKVTALVMNTLKHHITPFEIPEQVASKITFHLVEVPANIQFIPAIKNLLFSDLPYNAERFITKKYSNKLESLLKVNHFDIIQLEGLYLYPYIEVIRKHSKAKIVYRGHNIEFEIWERLLVNSSGLKKLYLKILVNRLKIFEKAMINQYDLLIPITERDLIKLNKLGNKKPALVIPAGINLEEAQNNIQQKFDNLFFIGALDWAPNQEGLVWFLDKCWNKLLKNFPNLQLTIAGRNAPSWLVNKFKKKNITYAGEVPDAKDYMLNQGIMIAPLFSGSGMRVKIIEAMNLKKPIVTTTIGCEGIDINHKVHAMIGDTPSLFINNITHLLQQEQLAHSISENCFTFVQSNYSNQNIAKRLINFYNKHTT